MSLPKIIKMGAIAAAVIGSGIASAQDFITIGTGSVTVFIIQRVALSVSW